MQKTKFVRLRNRCLLRKFESKMIYDASRDELYELDDEAFQFFLDCNGKTLSELRARYGNAVDLSISEGLIESGHEQTSNIFVPDSPIPSLRYILIHVTNRCNLRCKHCYVSKGEMEMDMSVFKEILDQFYDIGGIKVMITGGEPFLHSEINNILKTSADYGIRVELLTNGTVINEEHAKIIRKYVDEVQISVDGLKGHEMLRGEGTLEKTLKGIKLLDDMDISIATMITKFNLNEFDELEQLVKEVDASRWLLDYPCTDESILPPFRDAAEIMRRYGYGKESYESSLKLTCGTHLCAVTPDGLISRCGFYEPIGSIEDSLLECWRKICAKYLWNIEELECKCEHLETCKGGCRYRAEYFGYGKLGKDPLMCCYFES